MYFQTKFMSRVWAGYSALNKIEVYGLQVSPTLWLRFFIQFQPWFILFITSLYIDLIWFVFY